ncbi:ribosome biogenesis protein BOP1 homolog isoform X2 [Ctenocephalides felis]|uniref:ribosome biogenesis protein BOP1 homolog isoform X2 n=1 Tax=Ctenocephalides felis TaxID=7515 RepID=UPI000E6E3F6C|nr:ribosome biogenesis protein BOP1 homolog isoform X2 [Ctenocephalides felis]XP_026474073.1 ribosome biogenesis protein BOP1 homolog isoform X2 [Ctenocephalides felis]XP_026476147.1 ribosome biogenesis protein BOP1 homolog isoform X2 [Ctenocephalides felis]
MAPNGTLKRKGSKDVPKRYDEDVASISKTNGLENGLELTDMVIVDSSGSEESDNADSECSTEFMDGEESDDDVEGENTEDEGDTDDDHFDEGQLDAEEYSADEDLDHQCDGNEDFEDCGDEMEEGPEYDDSDLSSAMDPATDDSKNIDDNSDESEVSVDIPKSKDYQKIKKLARSKLIDTVSTNSDGKSVVSKDEYKHDSSDEEDIRNTVGNIPMNWYNEYSHLGYDWDGKKIPKPEGMQNSDQIDAFLARMEDPDFWRTVKDPQTGQDVVLSENDIKLIQRIQAQRIPDSTYEEFGPWIDWFTSEVMKTPIRSFPEHKRSFLPSKSEKDKVSKMVHALKMGWLKTKAERDQERAKKDPQFYMLWSADDQPEHMRRIHKHIAAPKRHLPGHAESYNPPPEYLFDKKELKQWNKQKDTPWKRKLHFVPEKYNSLREVPSYSRYIKERFLRCLDLYLCPRAIKMRLTIEPEALVPQLPSPKDLQPFPTVQSLVYKGHKDMIRCMTIDCLGQYLATGSDDMTVKVWEVCTGRCLRTISCTGTIRSIAWSPVPALSILAVAADRKVLLINPRVGDQLVVKKTDDLLETPPAPSDIIIPERVKTAVQWDQASSDEWYNGIRVVLNHFKEVKQVTWHGRGDYFATVMPEGQNRSVIIHQLSKRRSQLPFSKSKGLVQCVLFHPIRPFFFVATQRNVRIYDLVKQELVKKLLSNSRWISCMAVHPAGDNLLVGTYDRKMLWFDLDLSTKPYQTLRLHGTAVRGVAFHKRYPLFASGSDDRSLIISHGMVYNILVIILALVNAWSSLHHKSTFPLYSCMLTVSEGVLLA